MIEVSRPSAGQVLFNHYFKFTWFGVTNTPRDSPCLTWVFDVWGLDRIWMTDDFRFFRLEPRQRRKGAEQKKSFQFSG